MKLKSYIGPIAWTNIQCYEGGYGLHTVVIYMPLQTDYNPKQSGFFPSKCLELHMTEPSEQANKMINHNLGVTRYQTVSVSMIGQLDGRRSSIG